MSKQTNCPRCGTFCIQQNDSFKPLVAEQLKELTQLILDLKKRTNVTDLKNKADYVLIKFGLNHYEKR